MILITPTGSSSLAAMARLLCAPFRSPRQVDEVKGLVLEYAGQRNDPDHERRCTALLAALAWVHRQFSRTGGADIESVYRDLARHLARSCHEGMDVEALADVLASVCSENSPGGQPTNRSPTYVQLASDVLATLKTGVKADQFLSELSGSLSGQREGQDSGIDELYRCAVCAWAAIVPPDGAESMGRAIARDRILNLEDGKLDLERLGLCSLPDLPKGLMALNARFNDLTQLPELPAELTVLSVSGNPLPQLPTLPKGLTALDAVGGHLTCLPELPAGLRTLEVSNNYLTYLPELPTSLTRLIVNMNELRQLPTLPPGLVWLSVKDNQLRRLPALPASLTNLDAYINRLTQLPPSVFNMPHHGRVSVEGNPLSPAFLQQLLAATSAPGYSGPQIHFSMEAPDVADTEARPLHEAVRVWLNNNERARTSQWQAHGKEANAAEFSRFLDRLEASVNYSPEFRTTVAEWLAKLGQDAELRRLTFQVARGATETCEDRVALTYNNLRKLSHEHAVSRGDYDDRLGEIVERGRGAFRLDALEKIARKKAQTLWLVDEIEVYLAYQVQLRDRLHLPTDIANMRFFDVSGVNAQDLEDAEREVLAREQAEFPQYFLTEWAPWQQVLARLDPEGTKRARQQMHDMLPDYDREVTARLNRINLSGDIGARAELGLEIIKPRQLAVYKELTQELLRKRGEEALMKRIMGTGNQRQSFFR
ncbi:NEL-type E3 ubiquitin ligase domain-containing protein [Pandoraea pulmonicola]|nr:NEL-type E3 ubiquitin ligase domain-containing protein [Pandoraea pulmonicola]